MKLIFEAPKKSVQAVVMEQKLLTKAQWSLCSSFGIEGTRCPASAQQHVLGHIPFSWFSAILLLFVTSPHTASC